MNRTPDMVAHYIETYYVPPRWVAEYYGVPLMALHRATRDGRFDGAVVIIRSRGYRNVVLYNKHRLPKSFPRPRTRPKEAA